MGPVSSLKTKTAPTPCAATLAMSHAPASGTAGDEASSSSSRVFRSL